MLTNWPATWTRDKDQVEPGLWPGPALFIVFEGGEGAGKSTQVQQLHRYLSDRQHRVFSTHEPGATVIGSSIRELVLHSKGDSPTPRTEALLFAADRAQHVETVIRPILQSGTHVLCDRYVDSSIAYQGAGRALSAAEVARLSEWAAGGLLPDLTVLLDIDPARGLHRARHPEGPDRMERELLGFHERVRAGFLAQADNHPERYLLLDATRPVEELAVEIATAVAARIMTTDFVVPKGSTRTSSSIEEPRAH